MKQGWEIRRLEEICLRITDGSHFSPKEDLNGKYPMLSVKDMGVTCFSYDNCKYINEDDYKTLVANGCKPSIDDVLVAKDGSYLKTAFVQRVEKEQVILSSIAILTPNKTILNPDFLAFFFKSHHTKDIVERNYLTGTAIKRVILKGFRKISLSVPPIAEQGKIVAELDCLSGIIEKKKQQLKELDNLAQSIFYEMFGDPVENDKGWEVKKIGEVCIVERGGSPRPINAFITDDENGVNWIKIGDATEGSRFITSTKEKIIPEGVRKSRMVYKGDFILSNSMSFGRPYIMGIDGCIHDGWLVLRDKDNVFDKTYLYYYLGSSHVYQEFKRLAVGGVVNNLNSELVRGVRVAIPSFSVQQDFASKIESIEKQKELIAKSIKETETLFNSRMDYYFN